MKKHSPFVNIPTIPTTFSGQWLTFSHMANHYRKLINVKPRVDTNVPRNSFTNIVPSKSSGTKQLKTVTGSSKSNQNNNNNNSAQSDTKTKKKWTRPKMASRMLDYEYHALSKGLMNSPNGSFKGSSCSDGYQVVFGPSSIKSSVDAIVSDPDPDIINNVEPQLSSISIGEKIRKFLDHIHAQDQHNQNSSQHKISNRPLSSGTSREPRESSGKSREQLSLLQMSESRHHNRHSNCFTPFEGSSAKAAPTKKRLVTHNKPLSLSRQRSQRLVDPSSASSATRTLLSSSDSRRRLLLAKDRDLDMLQRTNLNNNHNSNKKYIQKPSSASCTHSHHHHHHNHNHQTLQELISSLNSANIKKTTKSSTKRKSTDSPNMSPRSVSVGTIRGSDELTEEFLMPTSPLPRNQSTIQIDTGDLPTSSWLKDKVERGVVRINNAYFHLAGGTTTTTTTSAASKHGGGNSLGGGQHHNHHHHHHHQSQQQQQQLQQQHPNKDSSRDSAYGFSSGESRITTRESTPEKKSSAAAAAANSTAAIPTSTCTTVIKGSQEHGNGGSGGGGGGGGKYKSSLSTVASSINQDNVDSSGHSSCSEKSILRHTPPSPFNTNSRHELLLDEKYINFLAMVTDDIVGRGIYTNKGIKSAFKSHLMKRSDLEMDKMLCLLERLRMDMGVPKDDSLNQLEFGYGSIEYSTGPYFYRHQPSLLQSPLSATAELEVVEAAAAIALTTNGFSGDDDDHDDEDDDAVLLQDHL